MTNTVKKVWVWILSFLKLKPQSHSISNNVIPISSRQQRKKIKRDSTLKDLLDNLDYAFNEIKVDYHRWSHISKKQIKGLKRYGVSVIPGIERSIHKHDYKLENTTDRATDVISTSSLSSVIFIATNAHKSEDYLKDDDIVQPDFFYALKMNKPPWFVAHRKGIFYECAFGYVIDGKQWWSAFFISIDPKTGEIKPTYNLCHEDVYVPKHGAYSKKIWRLSSWKNSDTLDEISVRQTVALFFNQWQNRTKMWSTTVEKDDIRANFYVDTKDTKYYFKDRDKSFTENGATKKIIHFVEDHERVIDSKRIYIKAHIRGQDTFNWNGYKCKVLSPKFHGIEHTQFDVSAVSLLPGEKLTPKFVSLEELANQLHAAEDKAITRRRTA